MYSHPPGVTEGSKLQRKRNNEKIMKTRENQDVDLQHDIKSPKRVLIVGGT